MVEQRQTHGILVFSGDEPVGWCQYGGPGEFAYRDGLDAPWRITCFCTAPDWRGKGVSATALRAALRSIERAGGRVVEGRAVPNVPQDHPSVAAMTEWNRRFSQLYREHGGGSAVFKRHKRAQPRATVRIRGVGEVDAWPRSTGTFFHGGSVALFEAEGFKAVDVIRKTNKLGVPKPSLVVMRKKL